MLTSPIELKRDTTTNGEIGPVTDQIYEILNCMIFVILIIRVKSKLCIYTKHSLLTFNLLEQYADEFVQFSDLAKNWHFCTPIIVNISIPPPLDQKISDIQSIFFKRSKCVWPILPFVVLALFDRDEEPHGQTNKQSI